MTIPPGYLHDNTVSRLLLLLSDFLGKSDDKGMLYVPRAGIKGPNSWLEPDLFYVAAKTQARHDPKYPDYMTTADLVIEVISPESAIYDRNTKADTYAALGVKELWLVDEPSRLIEIRVLRGDRFAPSLVLESHDHMRSEVLTGFAVKVGAIFDD